MIITMTAWMAGEKSSLSILSKKFMPRTHGQADKACNTEEPNIVIKPTMIRQQVEEKEEDVDIDVREVYFLIMHFLASGPCTRATGQLWNELLQHKLLPRRYHAWFSRSGIPSGDEDDDGVSFPLSYIQVVERNPEIEKSHLVKLLRQQLLAARREVLPFAAPNSRIPTAADAPTLLGSGPFSLLKSEATAIKNVAPRLCLQLRWPHWHANQVHGLALRELGGGFSRHHRPPSVRAASYTVMKPSLLVERIQIIKKFRGHRNAVYCAIFDRTGQHIITGSDDRLVKIWSTETGFCLRSCRGHEGDITELSVSSGNTLVASASNDYTIRVWRLPDGVPISVLRGHTGAVTAISFSPRQSCEHHLLSSSDDGTCRIWDARDSSIKSRVYMPNPDSTIFTGKSNISNQPIQQAVVQISCCSFNADGSIFVTGSCDKVARVWDARKWNDEITGKPNHELDILAGHENAVNYVQFSGCAGPLKPSIFDNAKEERTAKFKNASLARDSIVTCSRDGSAIIWICKPRKKDVRYGRWVKSYHLRVPPPPMPPHPPRGGGPRQRFLPTPRGVNMIVWSLDNRFVLAAIMDCRICVWNAIDGSLVHSLTGHTHSTFVVDVHPFNPRIAMSAGYDGRIIIWDIWEGRPLRVYETGDFQIVDGSFSPDGTSLVVSDEVGQVYLLTTGEGKSQKDAKYDQFFLGDFRPLVRDLHGNVLDQETQLPPHQRNIQDLLCDANMIPYEEPYQSMYQQRRLGALGIDWQPLRVNLAVGIDDMNYIPFLDHPHAFRPHFQGSPFENTEDGARWVEQPADADEEMDWEQDITKFSDDTTGSDYSVSDESLSLLDDEGTATSTEVSGHTDDFVDGEEEEVQLRRSKRNKRKAERISGKYFGKKVQKLPPNVQLSHENEFGQDKRSVRQNQGDVESSKRLKSEMQVARPKRLAAKNALQLFSHINKNEGDDDDASSSHHETSSYSAEQENESDGLLSYPPHKNYHDLQGKEKDVMLDRETREEVSQSVGKDMMEVNAGIEDTEKDGGEYHINYGKEKSNGNIQNFWNDKSTEEVRLNVRDDANKMDIISNTDEADSSSKQLRQPRRLVLKLRKNELVTKASMNKGDLEDTESEGGNWTKTSDQMMNIDEPTKRKTRRLIIKRPQNLNPGWDSAGALSDTADNGDCTAYEETQLRNHTLMLTSENKKNEKLSVATQPKKHESATGLQGKSSPSSLSCSDDRSASIKSHGVSSNAYPEEMLETSSHSKNADGDTMNQELLHLPMRQVPSGKTFLDCKHERLSAPKSSAEFQQILDGSDSNVYQSHRKTGIQNDKIRIGYRTDVKENLPHMSSPNSGDCVQYHDTNSRESTGEEHYGEDEIAKISKMMDQEVAMDGPSWLKRGRKTLAYDTLHVEDSDDYQYLLMNAGDFRETDSVRLQKKVMNLRKRKGASMSKWSNYKEGLDVQVNKNDAGQSFSDDLNERHSESDFIEEDSSWNASDRSEKVTTETAQSLRHKKRTLGGIESTDNTPTNLQNGSFISQGKRKVKAMVGQGEESRSKRDRGKRKTMKEACSYKKQLVWEIGHSNSNENENPGHVRDGSMEQDQDDQYETNMDKSDEIDLRRSGQGDASTSFEKPVLRHTRREKQRTDPRGHVDTTLRERNARTRKSLAWLLLSEVEEGTRYIPQFGDEVAYLRQGHAEYLNKYNIDEAGPWEIYQVGLRAVEFCHVVGLNYVMLPVSGETCCRYTLEFSDDASPLCGNTFWLTLTELTNFPDFIVERSRYDASIERSWTNRDRCKIWWRSQNGQGGEWWEGRVVAVKPKSPDFPDSPWERLLIQYKSDPTEPYSHSPWELFDLSDTRWEPPQLGQDTRERLLSLLEYAASEPEDLYGLRKLKQSSCKSDFINRLPLPLTLDVMKQRLEKDYYHSIQAFYFDVQLLASNAEIFCGLEHPMAQGLKLFAKEIYGEISCESST